MGGCWGLDGRCIRGTWSDGLWLGRGHLEREYNGMRSERKATGWSVWSLFRECRSGLWLL